MRKIVLAIVIAVLPNLVAVAEQSSQQPKNSPKSRTLHPDRHNPCAKYGVGFAGSDTCVKIGGGVSVKVAAALAAKHYRYSNNSGHWDPQPRAFLTGHSDRNTLSCLKSLEFCHA